MVAVAVSLGPQRQLPQPSVRQLPSAFFGTGFFLHQGDVLIQGHFCSLQSFDRDAFEPFRSQPHVESPLSSIDEEHHLLSGQGLADVIGLMIDGHAAISADSPRERLPLERVEPRIRVHLVRKSRQPRQDGKCLAWRLVATGKGLIGSLVVLMLLEDRGHLTRLLESVRPLHG